MKDVSAPEYQYHLKDHLGNVRVTFTTQAPMKKYTAGFETANQTSEANDFGSSYPNASHLNTVSVNATSGTNSYYLNGGYSGQVGLAKSLSVMPGDQVSIQAYAKYGTPSGTPANFNSFVSSLLAAFNLSVPAPGETGTAASGVNTFGAWEIGPSGDESKDDPMKIFATIIVFDRNYNFIDVTYKAITSSGGQANVTYTVKQPGYAYLYVSNEHPYLTDVYFDDITVTHTLGPVIQQEDYYPFGLSFNSYSRENSVPNNYLYNGKELQNDLSLDWYDYGARMYMPEIGRWGVVDPLSEKYYPASPYAYVVNNPVNLIDPSGRSAEVVIDQKKKTMNVNMVFVFYGSGANSKNAQAAVDKIVKMWNANAGKDGYSNAGDGWKIKFSATQVVTDQAGAEKLAKENEGNSLYNFMRVEDVNKQTAVIGEDGKENHEVSKMEENGGNSGFWITKDMRTTTPAHETGHGFFLDPWHTSGDGIMVPGTDNRKVTPSNLEDVRKNIMNYGKDKSSLIDKYWSGVKVVNFGNTNTAIYDKDGYKAK